MFQSNRPVNQTVKYSPAKDIFFLIMFLSALIITFLNLPGMLAVAYYDENFQPLAVRQCWTFSLCSTLGFLVILSLFLGGLKSALKSHLLLSFGTAAYLAVSYFGFNQQYPKKCLELYLPASMAQQLQGIPNGSPPS